MRLISKPPRNSLAAGILLVTLVAIFGWFLPEAAEGDQCYDYPDTMMVEINDIPLCAFWGSHCIECVAGGASCVGDTNGNSGCIVHDIPRP